MSLILDARSIAQRDPAAKSIWQVLLLYPGFHVLISHRLAHACYRAHLFLLARLVSQTGRFLTGIEIHPGAKIGKGLNIHRRRYDFKDAARDIGQAAAVAGKVGGCDPALKCGVAGVQKGDVG